jgi:ADP-heptose:LPS heptosyltransferase
MSSTIRDLVSVGADITPFPDPARIAIFQALNLGDLLCATPALRAVRRRFPDAHVTLIGREWARDLISRLPSVDRFYPFPGFPGIAESPSEPPEPDHPAPAYDLAIQMHGSGNESNGYVASLGAARSLGYGPAGDRRLSSVLAWVENEPEPLRWLRLVAAVGASTDNLQLEMPITTQERRTAAELLRDSDDRPRIGLHIGSSVPSRRWPVESFAALADLLVSETGAHIILTGITSEQPLTAAVQASMRSPALDLAGRTTIGEYAAVIASLDLLVTNDTSASHIAAAMRTRSVVLYGPSRPDRWAPLDLTLHHIIDAMAQAGTGVDGTAALQALTPEYVAWRCRLSLLEARLTSGRLALEQPV